MSGAALRPCRSVRRNAGRPRAGHGRLLDSEETFSRISDYGLATEPYLWLFVAKRLRARGVTWPAVAVAVPIATLYVSGTVGRRGVAALGEAN